MNNWLDVLEKKFGRYEVSNMTQYLVAGQVLGFLLLTARPESWGLFQLVGGLVMQGELWRILTFMIVPMSMNPLFFVFGVYLYYLFGNALEAQWGAFRYNLFLLLPIASTVVVSLLMPGLVLGGTHVYLLMFLAFAQLVPDFELRLFFILPVKIKWLAALSWLGVVGGMLMGGVVGKITGLIIAADFLLFFGADISQTLKYISTRRPKVVEKAIVEKSYDYKCAECGITNEDDEEMDFSYCEECNPVTCYCRDHEFNHQQKK